MDHPEITERENWGVPDPPRKYQSCHHCDTFRGFERACGCVVCKKCAAECYDCGQSFCLEHTYKADDDDGVRVRICHSCQSSRNYFAAQKEPLGKTMADCFDKLLSKDPKNPMPLGGK